jgi:hypothetical protein
MRNRWPLLGILVGLLVGGISTSEIGAASGLPRSGSEIYQRIQLAAANGDKRAEAGLAALDRFMAARGLDPDDLGVPALDLPSHETQMGLVTVRVEDGSPWHISVHNATRIQSGDQLLAYVSARHAALDGLAAADASREIDVVISPARRISFAEFVGVLTCPCTGVSLSVDVYGPDGWLMQAGHNIAGRDIVADADAIESEIRQEVALTLDLYPGVKSSDLEFAVRRVSVKMPANAAVLSARHDDVLAIDPLTDLADAYAGRSAVLEVEGAPDVREVYARLVLHKPVDANPIWPTSAGES